MLRFFFNPPACAEATAGRQSAIRNPQSLRCPVNTRCNARPLVGLAFGSSNRLHVISLFALCQQRRARAVALGIEQGVYGAASARIHRNLHLPWRSRERRLLMLCASIKNVSALQKCKTKRLDQIFVRSPHYVLPGKCRE
jgi:hypothetical protein